MNTIQTLGDLKKALSVYPNKLPVKFRSFDLRLSLNNDTAIALVQEPVSGVQTSHVEISLMPEPVISKNPRFVGFDNVYQDLLNDCRNVVYSRARFEFEPCEWVFKSRQCGYSGADATCDKSPNSCRAKGRFSNFSGLPGETMNYELLRPFNLEAAKAGAKITDKTEIEHTFAAEAGADGDMAVRDPQGNVFVMHLPEARMVPLAWVEGKPVYRDDVLYVKNHTGRTGSVVTAEFAENGDGYCRFRTYNGAVPLILLSELTWNPPKVKKEGWINLYPANGASQGAPICGGCVHATKEKADRDASLDRTACIHIEWEE